MDRRTLLKLSGLSLVGATAGCLEGEEETPTATTTEESGGGGDGGDETTTTTEESGGDESSYTIGMVDSLTGSLAPYGERNTRGRELALAAINEVGIGSEGASLNISVEDDESTNQGGVNGAQVLVNQDGVPLLIGSVGSGVSIAIHDSVTRDAGVVQISQNSTSPELTTRPELLRMSPSGSAKGQALASLVNDDGHDTVAVTWINNDYGTGLSDVFAETFESEFDGTVAYNEPHDQGQSSYSGILTEMASTDASAWIFLTYANEYTVMVNEGFDQGYNTSVDYYGAESTVADSIIENTPEGSMDGMTGITESAPQDQENYQNFVAAFEENYDGTPTVWSAYAYDAVTVAAIAIEAADEFTGEALASVVRDVTRPEGEEVFNFEEAAAVLRDGGSPSDINYQGVSGPVDLDENGDPPGYYQIYSVEDHEYVFGDYITS
ncbi:MULTISPECIES: ABC transporter substrate-binding protein [unclassified Haloferax]|uniref:ABC transporter substrate-binding protein n=1 Tax=unclassified Haloferax TaxID=2625095 RepID=UPI0002B20D38|nr:MULTISPECIES: ABC transporter substrate-binding protein [unclassified Haloferax]ELZ60275.1 putative branched-chain amino acids ABC transporter periplasmic substrate-binding protein [Haloferax sp. ATCC BAA-646]ELZ64487.1 putative branched-chain amino acids ABC transporter periplasmic substrate-binding protein [Haloferax sp. ATCC BAA-645]ELZ69678.1 putative branched-chain amino acids ABC transporter periplasmic substrate-binding protein [Haloferax sp. ATCC BAA-644]